MSFSLSRGRDMDVTGVGIAPDELPPFEQGAIDPRKWFAPEREALPMELEIGSGKGTFLVRRAAEQPGVNYVGLEYARAFWRYAADRVRRNGLANVKLVNVEAAMFLRNYVPDGCFSVAHVYFPDPWPKARHHKRRLIQEPFLRLLHTKLTPGVGATVRIATDHADYFAWMREHIALVPELFEAQPWGDDSGETSGGGSGGELVGTNFERKYRREGRTFNALVLLRLDAPGA